MVLMIVQVTGKQDPCGYTVRREWLWRNRHDSIEFIPEP
jgi:hypothetical protein